MLKIIVPGEEFFDNAKQEFLTVGDFTLELEHSLASLSKWEQLFEKPFISREKKTTEETIAYIKAMCLTPDVPSEVYNRITSDNLTQIYEYIDAKMTATWFNVKDKQGPGEIVTAEVLYYWMISLGIPFECQYWHLNRLITLIRVCDEKNAPKKRLSFREIAERNRMLNAQRRSQNGSRG